MSQISCEKFQATVSEHLVRHKSIIDTLSKFQESSAWINRAVAQAVTECGCLEISASKQEISSGATLADIAGETKTHLEGNLCANCREALESNLGNGLFYLTALCSLLDLDLEEILGREHDRISTLGLYSLT